MRRGSSRLAPPALFAGEGSRLVWSPGARDRIAELIDDAGTRVLQNERYQDPLIIERLVRAACAA